MMSPIRRNCITRILIVFSACGLMQHVLNEYKPANQKDGKNNRKNFEIFIDESLNGRAEEHNKTGNQEESKAAAKYGCREK